MAHIVGTNGNDSLVGTSGVDTIEGLGGNDTLVGNAGNDSLNGGLGNDFYFVGAGDVLSDAGGTDTVQTTITWHLGAGIENLFATGTATTSHGGNSLDNFIQGNEGANWISGREGNDTLNGGGGNDTFNMSNGAGASYGNDRIEGGDGIDTLDFGAAARTAVSVNLAQFTASGGGTGGAGSVLVGSVENVNGSAFGDLLIGNHAANFLFGFNGDDTLSGGAGNDRLEGAAGADDYLFSTSPGAAHADTVIGFVSGTDQLVLDGNVHVNLGANGAFVAGDVRFHSGAGANTAHDADDRVIYNTATGQLWYDADGTGSTNAAELIATLQGAPGLIATDVVAQGSASGSVINGTAGDDTLTGTDNNDTINGLGGNDQINGGLGNDRLDGGSGNDFLVGLDGADLIIGGDGNDTLEGQESFEGWRPEENGESATLPGDTLQGGLGNDVYYMQALDVVSDTGGIDTIITDLTQYTLADGFENLTYESFWWSDGEGIWVDYTGNAANNVIDGGTGLWHSSATFLDGGDGNDTLHGGGQALFTFDAGSGNYGNDVVHGAWSGTVDFTDARSAIFADLAAGSLTGGGNGGSGSVTMFRVGSAIGGAFNDHIIGDVHGENGYGVQITGGGGNDTIEGGTPDGSTSFPSHYQLFGGDGNDLIVAHGAGDYMEGGAGADDFQIQAVPTFNWNNWLNDFASGADDIVLNANTMTALGASGDFSAGDVRFHAGASAHDADDRVIWDAADGELFYDADGNGSGEAQLIATMNSGTTVVATDFTVVNGTAGGSTINGTSGDDSLVGTPGDDTINGLAGNDTIQAGEGADSISGGSGNDSMFAGVDTVLGDDAADTLDGGLGDDTYRHVSTFDGDVVLPDAGGIDTVFAIGDHTLGGGLENLRFDDFFGGFWNGTGNELDNSIVSASEGGNLFGMGGNDVLVIANFEGFGSAHGGDGNDTLEAGRSSELFGDAGNDTLVASAIGSTMSGGAGNDNFVVESAGGGHDIEDFASGADKIRLDATNMTELGASGNFAAGDERFHIGAAAHDADDRVIYNTSTGDLFYDADGSGSGLAEIIATVQPGATVVATDIAVDNGTAGDAGSTINGTANNDTLVGGAGNDTINGLAGADLLQGLGGNDSIVGGTGWDTLQGGDGGDWLQAGGWSDTMTGGAGADSFVWGEAGNNNRDTVTDFASGTDELLFENGTLTAMGAAGAWAAGDARFWAAAGATGGHDADDRLVYNSTTGNLYYDADGSGAGTAQVVATFTGAPGVVATDITVI